MCNSCENKFSSYDEVAKKFFTSDKPDLKVEYPVDSREDYVLNPIGYDSAMIARFYLTLLWRADAHRRTSKMNSNHPYVVQQYELVEMVNLGSYFERIGKIISENKFPIPSYVNILLLYIEIPEEVKSLREFIPLIIKRKFEGNYAYEITIKGIKAVVIIGKKRTSKEVNMISLSKSSRFRMLRMSYSDYQKSEDFNNLVKIIFKKGP